MRLSYRAASYDYNQPTLEVTEGEILGKYRGNTWRCRTIQEHPASQPDQSLRYRGVSYTTHEPCGPRPVDVAVRVAFRDRCTLPNCVVPNTVPTLRQLARIHRQNLEQNLDRRLRSAKQRGDKALVRMLEAERRQLV